MQHGTAAAALKLGEKLEQLPETAAAFAAGDISRQHASAIADACTPERIDAIREVEQQLVALAREVQPKDVRAVVRRLADAMDGDHGAASDEDQHAQRRVHASVTLGGMVMSDVLLDPEGGEIYLTALKAEMEADRKKGDSRTPAQRKADAFVNIFRRTLDINVFGTLLAVHHCLHALRASAGAIVTFSGGGGTGPLPRFDAYAASKAAIVRLSENLAAELEESRVRVNCVAPGFVATGLHESTLAAGPESAGSAYYERTRRELAEGGVPARAAAELVRYLLGDPDPVPFSGRLISAQWDPWRDAGYAERLSAEPELATLRR